MSWSFFDDSFFLGYFPHGDEGEDVLNQEIEKDQTEISKVKIGLEEEGKSIQGTENPHEDEINKISYQV